MVSAFIDWAATTYGRLTLDPDTVRCGWFDRGVGDDVIECSGDFTDGQYMYASTPIDADPPVFESEFVDVEAFDTPIAQAVSACDLAEDPDDFTLGDEGHTVLLDDYLDTYPCIAEPLACRNGLGCRSTTPTAISCCGPPSATRATRSRGPATATTC